MKTKMLHTCLRVKDLQASIKFYQEALGLKEVLRKDFPEHKFTIVYLSDEFKKYELELTYNYDTKENYTMGNGFSHTAVGTEDIKSLREKHIEKGYEVTDIKSLPDGGVEFYFVTDPDGYKVEVIKI